MVVERREILINRKTKPNNYHPGLLCCFVSLLMLSVVGCGSRYVAGDWFSVIAEIENAQGKQLNICEISLQNLAGEMLHTPDSIPGKFHKVFNVSQNAADYVIKISCPGYKIYETEVTYGENVTPVRPLKIGVIVMEPI